jgi:hypothetical protein
MLLWARNRFTGSVRLSQGMAQLTAYWGVTAPATAALLDCTSSNTALLAPFGLTRG